MSKEEKKNIAKIPTKIVKAVNPTKRVPVKQVPATNVLATFDDVLEDFRNRFRESIWTPWEWNVIEPYATVYPVLETYADLVDEGNKYLVRAEAPGIPREKIDVTVTRDGIEISGETGAEDEEKNKNYVVRERSYSSIYKLLAFPEEVIPEKAECTLKNGILEVSVPKKAPIPPAKKHKLEVKEAK